MSTAARSMTVWIVYLAVIGTALLVVPNVVLGLFGVPATDEPWIRVLGAVVIGLGILYRAMVRTEHREGFQASVWTRLLAAVAMTVLAFTTGPWQLAVFASFDATSATWTHLALRLARPAHPG